MRTVRVQVTVGTYRTERGTNGGGRGAKRPQARWKRDGCVTVRVEIRVTLRVHILCVLRVTYE